MVVEAYTIADICLQFLAAFPTWHSVLEQAGGNQAGQLLKQYHVQPLNYGSAVGDGGAIISKMAIQDYPASF